MTVEIEDQAGVKVVHVQGESTSWTVPASAS